MMRMEIGLKLVVTMMKVGSGLNMQAIMTKMVSGLMWKYQKQGFQKKEQNPMLNINKQKMPVTSTMKILEVAMVCWVNSYQTYMSVSIIFRDGDNF